MSLYTHPKIQAVIQIDNKENLEKKYKLKEAVAMKNHLQTIKKKEQYNTTL